jgi:hypothetical protein
MQFFELDINVEITYDPYSNKYMKILHQNLCYNQTYNFDFNHDHKF